MAGQRSISQKENGQIRIYKDFPGLIKACPRQFFGSRHRLIGKRYYNLRGVDVYGWYSEYNQIKMHSEDEQTTTFRSSKGFYLTVMHSWLQLCRSFIHTHDQGNF